jgi:hypothetical protein
MREWECGMRGRVVGGALLTLRVVMWGRPVDGLALLALRGAF